MVMSSAANDKGVPAGEITPIQREGLAWLALMVSGRATVKQLAAMEDWRTRSPTHADALAQAVALHRLLAAQAVKIEHFSPAFWERPINRRLAFGGMAASLAGIACVHPPLGLWPSLAELSSDYRTGIGEQRKVAVAGGVALDLNTRTSIALRSRPDRPAIDLIAGEITAAVHLPWRERFVAVAGDIQVSAAKSTFDIRRLADRVCVTCIDGELAIHGGRDRVTLKAREQVNFKGGSPGKPSIVDPAIVAAWRQGLLVFYNAPLANIVDEVNRYRPGKIVILDADLGRQRFNATFQIAHIEDVISNLQRLSSAPVTSLPGGIVLLG
jgi:transmembrane sensor